MNIIADIRFSAYFWVFLILCCARTAVELMPARHGGKKNVTEKTGSVSLWIMTAGYVVSQVWIAIRLLFVIPNVSLYIIGICLFVSGGAGRLYALSAIGNSYNQYIVINANSELKTGGPYSLIRHPLYFFYLVEMLGFLVIILNVVSLAAFTAVAGTILIRIRAEDELLAKRYGDQFTAYREETRTLIPYLW